jgi:nitroimidazol reductase NimA-like FMN-containing flavoprotein (pyridoxamine 5'-phosphate oxidase superfamily)
MGVQLTEEELWEFLAESHTGILTTLDTDGYPISLPTWHVVIERKVYLRTLDASAKVRRLRRDPRACFLAEGGEKWVDLRAGCLVGHASEVDDEKLREEVANALGDKYAAFRQSRSTLPGAVQKHYRRTEAFIEFEGDRRTISWYNRKIRSS